MRRINKFFDCCERLHRCATYVTVSKRETVHICLATLGRFFGREGCLEGSVSSLLDVGTRSSEQQ